MSDPRRRPEAFRLDEIRFEENDAGAEKGNGDRPVIVATPDPFAPPDNGAAVEPEQRRGIRWSRWLIAGASGLVAIALGFAIDQFVRDLLARNEWLGWVGIALTVALIIGLVGLTIRELVGLLRLREVGRIRDLATEAAAADDRKKAVDASTRLIALYEGRAEAARGRRALEGHLAEIIDGRDLVGLAEAELILPLDETARRIILDSAKRVSLVTAISPRALVDLLFVLAEVLRLIRRLANLYGGRPGTIGFFRLTRTVLGHLAITGGMAAGDSIVQQLLGQGVAARISARLGEGVVNGLLTARVGIAAVEVCRPFPFIAGKPPRISDVIGELTRGNEKPKGK